MTTRRLLSILILGCYTLPLSPATAQTPAPSDTTFTSNSELVLVPVHVMDHWGRPLHGLTKDNKGWNLIDSIDPKNAVSAVKVVIRDNNTGRIGSVVFPLSPAPAGS